MKQKIIPKVILSLDVALNTGWAIFILSPWSPRNKLVYLLHSSGACTERKRSEVVDQAADLSRQLGGACAVQIEEHPAFGRPKVIYSLGRSRGYWEALLATRQILGRAIRETPCRTWRRVVLGLAGNVKTEPAKLAALRYCEKNYKWNINSEDEAEAICLGCFLIKEIVNGNF